MIDSRNMKYIVGLLCLLVCCAAPVRNQVARETVLPEIDVDQVKKNSDNALRQSMEAKLDLEMLTLKMAELDNRLLSLADDFSTSSPAKIEELETRISLLTEAFKDQNAQLRQLEALASGGVVPVYEGSGAGAGRDSGSTSGGSGSRLQPTGKWGLLMPTGKGKPGAGIGATFSPSSAASLLLSPEYDAYQTGLRLYSSRKFKPAIKAFEEMLKQFPAGKYTDNAYYWLGECYYSLKEFSLAQSYYEKVFLTQGSQKADDAQFKIAMTRLSMGKQNDAKMDLKKLIDRYPASEYRERAARMLKQLK